MTGTITLFNHSNTCIAKRRYNSKKARKELLMEWHKMYRINFYQIEPDTDENDISVKAKRFFKNIQPLKKAS